MEQQQHAEQPAEASPGVDIVAQAAAEAATPGADAYECPFCVMMRKGGCENVFKAFMECGERADKGNMEMADCLPQFESLHLCMEKNKAVFDGLLQEMKDEDEDRRAAARAESEAAAAPAGSSSSSSSSSHQAEQQQAGVVAGSGLQTTQHQQEQQQQQPQQAGLAAGDSSSMSIGAGASMAGAS